MKNKNFATLKNVCHLDTAMMIVMMMMMLMMMLMVVAAQVDFEAERKAMQVKMEAEVQELQTHLKWASR